MGINDTTTLSHHPYILCHFANYAHHKTLYTHLAYPYAWNEQGAQLCSLHSLTHKRRLIFSAATKISQHDLHFNITHRPSIAHALHSFCIQSRQTISAMLSTQQDTHNYFVIAQCLMNTAYSVA